MWFRRTPLPADVRRTLALDDGERVLAQAELAEGGWAVATTARLMTVGQDAARTAAAGRPWSDVDRASFDPERSVLTVEWVDAAEDTHLPLVAAEKTSFPQTLRERVEWSVVLAETVDLRAGGQVKVAVRRTARGTLFSQAVAGPGVDLADPGTARVVDATESRLRGASGLPL